jgi:GNAT acetyltransferase-like protein
VLRELEWELLNAEAIDAKWWSEWATLASIGVDAHPAMGALFVTLLIKCFGTGRLLFATLRRGDEPWLKLVLQAKPLGRWQVFCPPQATIAPLVFRRDLPPPDHVLKLLLRQIGWRAWKLDLPYQDGRFSLLGEPPAVGALLTGGWKSASISAPQGFEAYWASRPRELRENVARRFRKAGRDGLELQLREHTDTAAVGAAVVRYGELESRGWKGQKGTAVLPDSPEGRFYRELLTGMAASGDAHVFELWSRDALVASRLVISSGQRHIILKTTYDENMSSYSVGHLQMHLILQRLLSLPTSVVELYAHATSQQLQWASEAPEMRNLSVFRHDLARQLLQLRKPRLSTPRAAA